MARLDGQRALVTGAGSGLGRAIAHALVREGARVGVADLDAARAEAVRKELGDAALALAGDVAIVQDAERWVDAVREAFGGLEVLVNNAGFVESRPDVEARNAVILGELLSGQGQQTPLDATTTLSDESWRRMLAVHLDGTFHCTRAALRAMQAARYGRIVNVASVAALVGLSAVPHYSAAKGAIVSFTRAVAREVVQLGITVNAIAPGFIDTPLLAPFDATTRQAIAAGIPMGRLGRPEEVVPAVLLLADPANGFMTGQVLSMNGGQWM